MRTSWIVSSEKTGTATPSQGCAHCKHCAFTGSDAKDATPGGFVNTNGAVAAGDWKKALVERTGVERNISKLQRRNVNDFIRHVPVGVLMKGTRLLHVSSDADWVTRQMVGGHVEDDYSFFTLENKGRAATHGNDFRRVVQLTLMQDVHCFFAANYRFQYWRPVERRNHNNTKHWTEIEARGVGFGGELAGVVKSSWPSMYRPAAWASCSECELVFHNSVIPRIMQVSSIGVLGDDRPALGRHVPYDQINVQSAAGEKHRGIKAPWWMNPHFHSRTKVLEAQQRWNKGNKQIDESFFE